MTTDVALLHDPEYLHWVKVYAEDERALRDAFQHGKPSATGHVFRMAMHPFEARISASVLSNSKLANSK